MDISSLPLEIIANQILKYFDFSRWIKSLIFVSKRWQQAAIQSTVSKQIVISLLLSTSALKSLNIISRYNIDTLIIKNMGNDIRLLTRLSSASNKLNTIVFVEQIPEITGTVFAELEERTKHSKPLSSSFPQISTLVISASNFSFLRLFPNVSRLKLNGEIDVEKFVNPRKYYGSVKELEIALQPSEFLMATPGFGLDIFKTIFPNLQTMYLYAENIIIEKEKLPTGFKIVFALENPWEFTLSATSYHEFTYSRGETPLTYLINNKVFEKVRQLLESRTTTEEYEADLLQRSPCFIFPPMVPNWSAQPLKSIPLTMSIDIEMIKMLEEYKIVDYWETFALLTHNLQLHYDAIEHLKTSRDNLPITTDIYGEVKWLFTNSAHEPLAEIFAAIGDKETARLILNVKNPTDSATLAHQITDKDVHWLDYLDYFDATLENSEGHNPATVAFNSKNYAIFCKFREIGAPLQLSKFKVLPLQHFFSSFAVAGKAGYEPLKYMLNKRGEKSALGGTDGKRMLQNVFHARVPNSMDVIKYLFEELGESFTSENEKGHALIETIILQENDELTEYMGSKININHVDSAGFTPLLYAIKHQSAVPVILSLGADVNVASSKKTLPIIYACKKTKPFAEVTTVQELINFGADINTVDYDSRGRQITPLGVAIYEGKLSKELTYLLTLEADPYFVDDAGNTLHHTLLAGTGSAAEYPEVANFLADLGLDVNRKNNQDESPLHMAILAEYSEVVVKALLDIGADVNQPGPLKMTPLMMAVNGIVAVLEELLPSETLDLKARDVLGRSAVQRLCHEATPKYLKSALKRKYFCLQNDSTGTKVFVSGQKVIEALLRHATEENIEFIAKEVKEYIKASENESLAQFFTRATSHPLLTKFLVEKVGLDVNMQDKYGNTMMHHIYSNKKTTTDVMEYLLAQGAKVDAQNHAGDTPLLILLRNPSPTIARYSFRHVILKNGASVTIKNNSGIAAVDVDPLVATRYQKPVEQVMSMFDTARSSSYKKVDLTKHRAFRHDKST